MRTDLTAYTGQVPASGLVGFVNLSRDEATGDVVFTVRSEGDDSVMAAHTVPRAEAVRMLRDALAALEA